ncbi:MAG: hypothetical protein IPM71_12605 [Bacteroidota bacterium]|nr:MAG: hypothetical protein IPM71_12605 [Bacteroidota bacterium]
MKSVKNLLILWLLIQLMPSCSSAEKASHERRNLMMPERSELKRNDKYKPAKSKQTYKPAKQKNNKR